jgi:hypothetical protein
MVMNWLNLDLAYARAPEFTGSDPVERATWLCLLFLCAANENGGVLMGAGGWTDRQWQYAAGVTLIEVMAMKNLVSWEGSDLCVWGYPKSQEATCRANRDNARKGGLKSAARRQTTSPVAASPTSTAASAHASTERNGNSNGNDKGTETESAGETDDTIEPILLHEIIATFNRLCSPPMPAITASEPRRRNLATCWMGLPQADRSVQWFERMFSTAASSDFLCGRVAGRPGDQRGPFVATFDWLIKPDNFQKVVEGNYSNRSVAAYESPYRNAF